MAAITSVRVGVWIEHPYRAEVGVDLIAPDSTTVTLIGGWGSSFDDFGSGPGDAELCILDDAAPTHIYEIPPWPSGDDATDPGYPGDTTGSFQPTSPLADLNGIEALGDWTLRVTDGGAGDTGTLKAVSLWVETATDSYRVDSAPNLAIPDNDAGGLDVLLSTGEAPAPPGGGLEWHVTGLWLTPDATSVAYYGRIADPLTSRVEIPLNDARRASLTVSTQDAVAAEVLGHTYERCLKAYYRGILVFWGPVNLGEVDMAAGTITLSAVDPALRLMHHYLRRGDLGGTLNAANSDMSTVSVDHNGMRLVRDAANTLTGPVVGIIDGTNDFADAPDSLMGVSRGDGVWDTMQQIAASLGPDFELEPIEGVDLAYARLNTYTRQGSDKSDRVQFHYGTGLQNVEDLSYTVGSKLTTLVHVISRDGRRVTSANPTAMALFGQYIDWDAIDYDAKRVTNDAADAVLAAYGHEVIAAYGRPLLTVDLTLPFEDDTSFHYHYDYKVGDTVGVAGKSDLVTLPESDYRIVAVTLEQPDSNGDVRPTLTLVADQTGSNGDTIITATEDDSGD